MAPDERPARTAERCETHPATPAVGTCHRCGRALCIACAVPVRGEVVGPECLPEVVGVAGGEGPEPGRGIRWASMVAGFGFLAAALVTWAPWTRFGSGSRAFGAWAADRRWSMVAAPAAVLGVVVWAFGRPRAPHRAVAAALILLGGLVSAGGALAMMNPPPFTKPTLAPALALVGGVLGVLGSLLALRKR